MISLGCADKLIRVFNVGGKLERTIKGSTDVVRALCRLHSNHASGADFASAGNDGVIRLWTINGQQLAQLHGHESFIYSLTSLSTGEIISSGEDRTLRIWQGQNCIQTITHPAISVWCVSACSENGDLVSGSSDRVLRVFTKSKDREADAETLKTFENSVQASSIPQEQVGSINKEKLPGPEFLQQKSGTKEGQVQMIQETNGSISAHQWSQSSQSWSNVGTVVDSVGSSGKKTSYMGRDYDYVFDVDIEDGKPPLKLPYNLSQNPYEAATKFIQDNELPMTYLDEVANFITKNTQGATIGQQAQTAPDPWGSDARYRPGDNTTTSNSSSITNSRSKILPQTSYLSIKTANLRTIMKKISELNQQLVEQGSENIALSKELLASLESASKALETSLAQSSNDDARVKEIVPIVVHMLTSWPAASRLPALDLARLLAAATPAFPDFRSVEPNTSIVDVLSAYAFDDKDRINNVMLGVRALGNMFETSSGRQLADNEFDKIHNQAKISAETTGIASNRNLLIAINSLYLNYAVLFTSSEAHKSLPSSSDRALLLLDDLVGLLNLTVDSEAVYRGLVAAGTLLGLGEEIQEAAREVYDLGSSLKKIEAKVKETRVKTVVAEIKDLLKG